MLLRYYKKIIFPLITTAIIIGGLFLTAQSHRTVINIAQENAAVDVKEVLPTTTIATPFASPLVITETQFPDRVCDISAYGAVPGGKVENTEAFAKAISDCASHGGGKVTVPAGTWLTGPIKLTSNINLEIQKGADVIFSDNFADYLPPVFSRFEGIEYYNYSAPIYANNAENIAITGAGTLDGQGQAWWSFSSSTAIKKLYAMGEANVPVEQRVFGTVADGLRPSFIEFVNCNRILLSGVSIVKGPMWTIHPLYSQNIIIQNVNINTAPGPSTDGVVIDSSKNVLVDNVTLATGDDALVIKSGRDNDGRRVNIPSENIVLQNINVIDAHGAIALGSEMSGDIRNVLAQNFTIANAQYAFRVKSNQERGGTAENVWVKNLQINSLSEAVIQFNAYYERGNTAYTNFPPTFQNINIEDVTCKSTAGSINVYGLAEQPFAVNNLTLKNINILKARNGMGLDNAQNVTLDNINIVPKYGPNYDIEDSQHVILSNSTCGNPSVGCFYLTGKNLQDIQLNNDGITPTKNKVTFGIGTDKTQVKVAE